MSLSNNFPTVGPVLNLDFLNSGVLDPRITFTRASTATYFNQLGVLQTAQNNIPRFDYNPSTLAAQGLLIEEQRTNLLLRSQEFGTSWIRFGTTTLTENTSVAPDGTTTGDNIVFTSASAGIYQLTTGAALTTYTFSVWIKSSSSTQVLLVINTNLSDPTIQTFTVTSGWQRFSINKTTAAGTTSVTAQIQDNGSGNTQFDLWGAQLEVGAFATSYIPTTTTALTRNADVASMTGTNFSSWYNAAAGTIFARGQTNSNTNSACLLSIDDTTTNNRIQLRRGFAGPTSGLRMVSSGGSIDVTLVTGTATGVNSIAVAATASDQNAASNGTLFTGIVSITPMPTVTRMLIGDGPASFVLNGYIQRISYYNYRVSNAQLQALTGS